MTPSRLLVRLIEDSQGVPRALKTKHYHHGNLRQTLLDAAVALIQESGVEALSVRHLADRVGVSRTAPYHHFVDKHNLLCCLAEEGFMLWQALPADWDDSSLSLSQQVSALVAAYVDFATQHRAHYDLMFGREIWRDKSVTPSLKAAAHQVFKEHVKRVGRWRGDEDGSSEESLRMAQVSWGTLHGVSRLFIDGIYMDDRAKSAICHRTAEWMLCALASAEAKNQTLV